MHDRQAVHGDIDSLEISRIFTSAFAFVSPLVTESSSFPVMPFRPLALPFKMSTFFFSPLIPSYCQGDSFSSVRRERA